MRFEIAQLRRRQIVVEQHQVGAGRGDHALNLFQLAAANQRRRIGPWPPLDQRRGDLGAGAARQLFKLRQRGIEVQIRRQLRLRRRDDRHSRQAQFRPIPPQRCAPGVPPRSACAARQ